MGTLKRSEWNRFRRVLGDDYLVASEPVGAVGDCTRHSGLALCNLVCDLGAGVNEQAVL